jgi:hypothetical protein
MYASKMAAAEAALTREDRQHTIEVLCELIASPETSEADKEDWRRFLLRRDVTAYVKSYGRIN